jgi:protein AbiQ
MESIKIVKVNSKYCDYLRKFDSRVPYNSGSKELRPFIGVLFYIDDMKYFAPLSSPKPKHLKLKSKLDLLKLQNGELGVINFNNMIPVMDDNIINIDINSTCSGETNKKYNKLLQEQIYWINRNQEKVRGRSQKIYNNYINKKLPDSLFNRCCDFKLLEEKCKEYNKTIKE